MFMSLTRRLKAQGKKTQNIETHSCVSKGKVSKKKWKCNKRANIFLQKEKAQRLVGDEWPKGTDALFGVPFAVESPGGSDGVVFGSTGSFA